VILVFSRGCQLLLSAAFFFAGSAYTLASETWDSQGFTLLEEQRWGERELNPGPGAAARELHLHVVVLADSGWTLRQVLADLQEASQVYSQCSIKIGSAQVDLVRAPQGRVEWNQHEDTSSESVVTLRRQTPISRGAPVIYFVKKFKDNPEGTGFSNAQWREAYPVREELLNSVFISDYSHSEEYRKERENSSYSLVAHELLHVLTRLGGHYNLPEKNLLNIWKTRSNAILNKHCEIAQESSLLQSAR
jgi:hypothetical protein